MRLTGAMLAVIGAALIVLAAIQAATSFLGDSAALAFGMGVAGALLLVTGAILLLQDGERRIEGD